MRSLPAILQALPYALVGGLALAYVLKQLGLFGGEEKVAVSPQAITHNSPSVYDAVDVNEEEFPTGMDSGLAFAQHSFESSAHGYGDAFNPYAYCPVGMDPGDLNDARCFPTPGGDIFDSTTGISSRM